MQWYTKAVPRAHRRADRLLGNPGRRSSACCLSLADTSFSASLTNKHVRSCMKRLFPFHPQQPRQSFITVVTVESKGGSPDIHPASHYLYRNM